MTAQTVAVTTGRTVVVTTRTPPGTALPPGTTRLLAQAAVACLTGRDQAVDLRIRPGRRPLARQSGRRVWVSWSDTRDAAAAAASVRPVGVDVERCRPVRDGDALNQRLTALGLAGNAASRCSLLARWCALESALKALGGGFAVPLHRLRLLDSGVVLDGHPSALRLVPLDPPVCDGHHTAVAQVGADVRHVDLSARQLRTVPGSPLPRRSTTPRPTHPSHEEEHMRVTLDKEELRQVVADTIDQDVDAVTDTASFVDDLDVDSLMALEVVIVLERRYGVKLKEERLSEVTSLQAAYDLVTEELAAASA